MADLTRLTIATPPGRGGIAELHVWGPKASAIADKVFRSKSGITISRSAPGRILYGHLQNSGETIDEAIAVRRENDRIYGSETVEIGCHGGDAAAREAAGLLAGYGAASVTRDDVFEEAVIRGRISRMEAEAQAALLTCASAKVLPALLEEIASHPLEKRSRKILEEISADPGSAARKIRALLENTWAVPFVEPRSVFIAGFPNVGKSSIFNALCEKKRAIVHDSPGTTRDVIEEEISLDGLPLKLFDSAGMGESKDEIEWLAEEFALRGARQADLVVFVFEGSRPVKEREMKLYRRLDCGKLIPIINKADLPDESDGFAPEGAMKVSASTGAGMEKLKHMLATEVLGPNEPNDGPAVFTGRQSELLREALDFLKKDDRGKAAKKIAELIGT